MHYVNTEIDEGKIVFRHNFHFKNEILPYHYEERQLKEDRENILWID